jgi:hypothetical protein
MYSREIVVTRFVRERDQDRDFLPYRYLQYLSNIMNVGYQEPVMVERQELHFIEEMGELFERSGSPRMAGRVWGYLLIVEEAQLSSADLAEALDASPSSISSATRLLIDLGMLDRIRVAGERSDYFTIHHGAVLNLVRRPFEAIARAKELAARALVTFADRDVALPHLAELHDVYVWFDREFPALVERFAAERAGEAETG